MENYEDQDTNHHAPSFLKILGRVLGAIVLIVIFVLPLRNCSKRSDKTPPPPTTTQSQGTESKENTEKTESVAYTSEPKAEAQIQTSKVAVKVTDMVVESENGLVCKIKLITTDKPIIAEVKNVLELPLTDQLKGSGVYVKLKSGAILVADEHLTLYQFVQDGKEITVAGKIYEVQEQISKDKSGADVRGFKLVMK